MNLVRPVFTLIRPVALEKKNLEVLLYTFTENIDLEVCPWPYNITLSYVTLKYLNLWFIVARYERNLTSGFRKTNFEVLLYAFVKYFGLRM